MSSSPREIALVTSPAAGKGRGPALRAAVARRLRDSGLVVHDLMGGDGEETLSLTRDAVAQGADGVVVIGGDGMFHVALQAVAGTDVPIGLVPCGTGNDVARYFDLPRQDPMAAVDRIIAHRTRTIDLARSGDRWFVTVLAAGFDAVVNERANQMSWPRGQMRYQLATLAELRTFEPLHYTLDLDGEVRRVEAMLVAVGNGPSFGGGLRITEGALLDDGLLDVVIIKPMSRTGLVRTYPKLFAGTHVTHPKYEHHRVRKVTVAAAGIVAYADGERFGALPLSVECVGGALKVWV
ncbi:diacylglycerol kinase family protein [Nocardioides sp. 616]|uniref:diacylglycerol/lipid kinase family protein n=1 Tax=Nocardioides sp. 616 TaxID=2268090 RepID=UPI000CE462CC|nr:diacylglycerol kinase family protein [Nocardioides sp. 616]